MGYISSVELGELPGKVRFPNQLKDKIYYDANTKRLICNGPMFDEENSTLLSLSEDKDFQKAVNKLNDKSRMVNDWSDVQKWTNETEKIDAIGKLIRNDASYLRISEEDLLQMICPPIPGPPEPSMNDYYKWMQNELIKKGKRYVVHRAASGTLEVDYAPIPEKPNPRIILVETYALTSFLGDYGAGKTLKTFSLLPNEKTKISIKTWKTTETTTKDLLQNNCCNLVRDLL